MTTSRGGAGRAALSVSAALVAVTIVPREAVEAAPEDPVVVSAGSAAATRSEIQRRLARMTSFQLRTFGRSPEEIRRGFVGQQLARELLFEAAARDRGIENKPSVVGRIRRLLDVALRDETLARVDKALTWEDVRTYLSTHPPSGVDGTSERQLGQYRSSFRIALRREKARAERSALVERLRRDHLRDVDLALLDRIVIGPAGAVSAR